MRARSPLAPARRPPSGIRSRSFLASLLVHLLVLAVVLSSIRRQPAEYVPPAPVAMVFENGGAARTAAPRTARHGPPETPQAPAARLPLPAPVRPPLVPSHPAQTARLTPPAPVQPLLAPPHPAQTARLTPLLLVPMQPLPAPPLALSAKPQRFSERLPPAAETGPLLLPMPPAQPLPPSTAPPEVSRATPPIVAHPSPPYLVMNNMSFGEPLSAASPPASGGFNLALNQSPAHDAFAHEITIHGQIGPDWRAELVRWVDERKYYPTPAVEFNQQGSVTIHMVIDRNGRVHGVTLVSSSGSPFLDSAWLGLFQGAYVPAFPAGTKADQISLEATMHYILIN